MGDSDSSAAVDFGFLLPKVCSRLMKGVFWRKGQGDELPIHKNHTSSMKGTNKVHLGTLLFKK